MRTELTLTLTLTPNPNSKPNLNPKWKINSGEPTTLYPAMLERNFSACIGAHKRHHHHTRPSTHVCVNYEKKSGQIKDLHTRLSTIYHFGLTLNIR